MATYKQATAAYSQYLKAKAKLYKAVRELQQAKILPEPPDYNSGHWFKYYDFTGQIEEQVLKPLGEMTRAKIEKDTYGF